MKRIKHLIEYIAVITLLPLLSIIPYRIRLKIGSLLGIILYYLYRKRRIVALNNISHAFPEKDKKWQRRICKSSFRHLGKNAMEIIQLPKLNEKFLKKNFLIEGEENFVEALNRERGLIVIAPHLGNWEFIAGYFGMKGYPVTAIMKRQSNPYLNRMIEKYRTNLNIGLIHKREARREVPKALKSNMLVGFVADQDAGNRGVFINFLGRPASTARGPAIFAIRNQSPAVLIVGFREKDQRCRIKISPFLDFDYKRGSKEAIVTNTQIWTEKAEEYIRRYPDQYLWAHDRWKTKRE
jgi:KDO2-lipid IV(A) lauroyltransferase